jgi:TPR repeat protein
MRNLDGVFERAQGGDAAAQFELGQCYDGGKGVPQDPVLAVECYRKAAEGGYTVKQALGALFRRRKR